jgi:TfoX/Sxy family transcriptional regulator of competence genes
MIVTMAYDEDLANRIRELIASEDGYTQQKMFGGIGFMIDSTWRWGSAARLA